MLVIVALCYIQKSKRKGDLSRLRNALKLLKLQPVKQENLMPYGYLKLSPLRLHEHFSALGTIPKASLETFVDLGLTDAEIGRYFGMPRKSITKLREILAAGKSVPLALSG